MDWIETNQLGRRNLPPHVLSVLRGRIYNRRKKAQHRPEKRDQNDPVNPQRTAEIVARETGVSPATIKRWRKRSLNMAPCALTNTFPTGSNCFAGITI